MIRAALTACLVLLAPLGAAPVEFSVTDTKGRPVEDAVVSLVPLDAPARLTPPDQPLEIVQHDQTFLPTVTALVVGTTVSFPNRDTVQHHVYSLSPAKKFELPLYAGEAKAPVLFDRPGVVALGCNIHDWMSAYVVVLATPWFAKTGADGHATVKDLPPGHYRAEVWHARLAKTETREVAVAASPAAPLAFPLKLKAERRARRHPVSVPGNYN